MPSAINPAISAIEAPPIAEAHSWIAGLTFPAERPLIDLAQAAPGYPPSEDLRRSLAAAVMQPSSSRYTDIEGLAELRTLLAADITATYGGPVNPDQVLISAGCNQAFFLVAMGLAQAGDAVMLPQPWYFNHRMTLDMLGIGVVGLPCRGDAGFIPDPDEAEALLTDRVKAILLISPNNPTGAVYPPEILSRFADLARRRGIRLVVDETYRDFMAPGMSGPHGLFAEPELASTFVHLYSFSKVYSITGYRVGAVVADAAFIAEIAKVMDSLAICAPNIGQQAAIYGLRHLANWRAENRLIMAGRVKAFGEAMAGLDNGFRIDSIGAYFAFLRHPFEASSSDVAPALARDGAMLTLPDTMFGGAGSHLRVAFANVDAAVMPEVARRLSSFRMGG